MKIIKKIILISMLIIALIYTVNLDSMPTKLVLIEGEDLNINGVLGITIEKSNEPNYNIKQASTNLEKSIENVKNVDYQVYLFNTIPVKTIQTSVIPTIKVIPIGNTIGLKLYTDGVLVVGMSEVKDDNSKSVKPYENTRIKEGDRIIAINDKTITCTTDLVESVNLSDGNSIELKCVRNEEIYYENMTPVKTGKNEYKLGLWVRDAAAGVGTLSFYEPATKRFAALGHGILDVDTGDLVTIANGDITTANILSIVKGEKGNPGEIRGSITNQSSIGNVSNNTRLGLYGKLTNVNSLNISSGNEVAVATRNEIKTGNAKIICTLENNKKKEYDISIEKIFLKNNTDNKSMVIKVTDKELLDKTGGIIQGMSGSPIIQNNKLIGVVTHVLVNNPTMGYAIFADMMIKEMKKIE